MISVPYIWEGGGSIPEWMPDEVDLVHRERYAYLQGYLLVEMGRDANPDRVPDSFEFNSKDGSRNYVVNDASVNVDYEGSTQNQIRPVDIVLNIEEPESPPLVYEAMEVDPTGPIPATSAGVPEFSVTTASTDTDYYAGRPSPATLDEPITAEDNELAQMAQVTQRARDRANTTFWFTDTVYGDYHEEYAWGQVDDGIGDFQQELETGASSGQPIVYESIGTRWQQPESSR